jgi:hypothetical protein
MNPDILRLAHERVANGSLPLMTRFRTFGGSGSGQPCALCGTTMGPDGMEIDVESDDETLALAFHVKCQAAWLVAIANQRATT